MDETEEYFVLLAGFNMSLLLKPERRRHRKQLSRGFSVHYVTFYLANVFPFLKSHLEQA